MEIDRKIHYRMSYRSLNWSHWEIIIFSGIPTFSEQWNDKYTFHFCFHFLQEYQQSLRALSSNKKSVIQQIQSCDPSKLSLGTMERVKELLNAFTPDEMKSKSSAAYGLNVWASQFIP